MARRKREREPSASSPASTRSEAAEGQPHDDGAEVRERIPGRRLQLIPHTIDPKLVFRFEFGPAILAQVREQLEIVPILPITSEEAKRAGYPGFYQLLVDGESKYIGRTIRPIGHRLREHVKRLRGRIPLENVGCRFLYVEDLSLVGLSEDSLISFFHPQGLDQWGKQGFGSKVTGHGRANQGSAWDEAYPPDLNWPVSAGGSYSTLRDHVARIARMAPLTVSIPDRLKARFNEEFNEPVVVPEQTRPFVSWMSDLERMLHPGWKIDRKPLAWYIVPADGSPELETDSAS